MADHATYEDVARWALGFVLEDESWPVFVAWARDCAATEKGRAWAATADLEATRTLHLKHSPDPMYRMLGMMRDGV